MEFKRHYTRKDLEELFDGGFELPEGFLFGCANAAYQVEGGINGTGQPLNNWAELERSGRVEPSAEAIRWWTDYPRQVEMAAGMGLNALRIGIEWARVQPSTSATSTAAGTPDFDLAAIEAYADMVASVKRAGMEPVVTLQHFTHPRWLGPDFWLEREHLGLFERYVEEVSVRLNSLLVEKHSLDPVRYWITVNEPNGLAFMTYALGAFPHGKRGISRAYTALNNLIEAHCLAYDALHRIYRDNSWGAPSVTYNTISVSVYGADKIITDLLNARRNGVERSGLPEYLEQGKAAWDAEVAKSPAVVKASALGRGAERLIREGFRRMSTAERFSGAADAVYRSEFPDKLDLLALDFYDPFLRNMVKAPGFRDIREKRFNFNAEHWEWTLNPVAMYHFLKAETVNGEGLPLLIAENGMAHKAYRGRVEQRRDGATLGVFLRSFIFEALRARKDGVPLAGYLYWSMVDNYEWGSYDPRFGIFTVDRSRDPARISSVDAWGTDAAAAYRGIIESLRSGDRERIIEAFTSDD